MDTLFANSEYGNENRLVFVPGSESGSEMTLAVVLAERMAAYIGVRYIRWVGRKKAQGAQKRRDDLYAQ